MYSKIYKSHKSTYLLIHSNRVRLNLKISIFQKKKNSRIRNLNSKVGVTL